MNHSFPSSQPTAAPNRRRSESWHTFYLLVALAAGSQTLSELQSRIIGDTTGEYVQPSTLHAALRRLTATGFVCSTGKHYRLTDEGWYKLQSETRALEALVAHSKHRIISSGHGRW